MFSRRATLAAVVIALALLALPSRSGAEESAGPAPEAQPSSGTTDTATVPVPVSPAQAVASLTPAAADHHIATNVPDLVDRTWPARPAWDGCPRPVWPGEPAVGAPGGGRRVLIIGDSLTRESKKATAKALRASGWTPTFRCWGSKRLDWGLTQVARARQLGQLPTWVVIALGTNDISWESTATTNSRINRLLDRLGPNRKVMWVDLHLTRSAWLNARADWFNELIRAKAAKRKNLTVVRWHARARSAGIRGWDGIHYGPDGYALRAKVLTQFLNERALNERVLDDMGRARESLSSPIDVSACPSDISCVSPLDPLRSYP